jgi:hypothetical protein
MMSPSYHTYVLRAYVNCRWGWGALHLYSGRLVQPSESVNTVTMNFVNTNKQNIVTKAVHNQCSGQCMAGEYSTYSMYMQWKLSGNL